MPFTRKGSAMTASTDSAGSRMTAPRGIAISAIKMKTRARYPLELLKSTSCVPVPGVFISLSQCVKTLERS
jgi:hypothetical protein